MEFRKESITGQVRDDRGLDLEKWVDVRYISEVIDWFMGNEEEKGFGHE